MNILLDIVRLITTTDFSDRWIGRYLGVSKTTVGRYHEEIDVKGYTWEYLSSLDFPALDALFNTRPRRFTKKRMPDFKQIREEMQKPGVTLLLLWFEYRDINPDDALSYSQFTHHYRRYLRSLGLVMRQNHRPGQFTFVDFSGKRPAYIDPKTGMPIPVELYVAVQGCSRYIFATAVLSQACIDWISANVQSMEFFGGATTAIVPDNLRAAVTKPGRPAEINRVYREFARHYGTTILPARPRKPRDKAKVEVAVQIVQRWILARLRHRVFFSLAELNAAIAELVRELNERPFKRFPGCRRSRFEQLDKPALRPLPATPFEYAEWTNAQTVGLDYHVLVCGHWYSVPYRLVGSKVDARYTAATVELFHQHVRVASHVRSHVQGEHTTDPAHQPEPHRAYAERTPEKLIAWATAIGPNTLAVVQRQFECDFPSMGLPACDTLQKLAKRYGSEALEAAATRAVEIKSLTVKSVKSLLSTGLYTRPLDRAHAPALLNHSNIRGPAYFAANGGH